MTFFECLKEFLTEQICANISGKQKLELQNVKQYFVHCATVEQNLIQNLVDWRSFFETCDFLSYPSQVDIDRMQNLSDSDVMTYIVILNHALKSYIDNFQEQTPNCLKLHMYYKLLKNEVDVRPSFEFYTAKGDGFQDCLSTRIERHEQERKLEDARHSGLICIYCGSTNVKSYDSQKWHCKDCKRFFRKH